MENNPMETLDARNLSCPLPVLKAARRLRALPAGEMLTILTTDPNAREEFAAFCNSSGYRLVTCEQKDGVLYITLSV